MNGLGVSTVALNARLILVKLKPSTMRARLHGVLTMHFLANVLCNGPMY